MELKDAVVVVTGANRGLGRELATQLLERGAKVYAAARRPETVDLKPARPRSAWTSRTRSPSCPRPVWRPTRRCW